VDHHWSTLRRLISTARATLQDLDEEGVVHFIA
jgi:hypothetical protein